MTTSAPPLRILLLALLVPLVAACAARTPAAAPAPAASTVRLETSHLRPEVVAAAVLHRWDARRAGAWAAGSVRALRALYTPGCPAAEADVAALRAWRARDARLRRLTTQVLRLRVLERRPAYWRLRVVDRITGGTVVGRDRHGRLRVGRPTAWTIALVRRRATWLVASVRRARMREGRDLE